MTDFLCPNCNGGFPEPEQLGECPWCGQAIDGSYEYERPRMVSRVESKDEREAKYGPLYQRLFGWLE